MIIRLEELNSEVKDKISFDEELTFPSDMLEKSDIIDIEDARVVGDIFFDAGGIFASVLLANAHFAVLYFYTRTKRKQICSQCGKSRAAAAFSEIVQLLNNAVEISDAVSVCILEGLGIDFIKYCVV